MSAMKDVRHRTSDYLGLDADAYEPDPGEIGLWEAVPERTRAGAHLLWAVVGVVVFVLQRQEHIVDDGVGGALVLAVLVTALGLLVTERLLVRSRR